MYTIEYLVLHSSLQYRSHWFQKKSFQDSYVFLLLQKEGFQI